jgi:tetratricopeptide (TPR) repeat protein
MTLTYTRTLAAVAAVLLLAACGSPAERAADYLAKAQARYDAGDYIQARIEAQNAAQVEPKNPKVRYLLALIAEQDQDWKSMFGSLMVVVAEDPANIEARLKLGQMLFLSGNWTEAAVQSKALLKLAPEDSRVRLLGARVDLQNGDLTAGRAGLAKALKLDPENIDAILVSSAFEAVDSPDKGLAILDAGIQRLPEAKVKERRELRERRIPILVQDKRFDEAEQGLAALAKDFPDVDAYPLRLARLYASQGRTDEAEQLLRRVTELDPKDDKRRLDYVQFLVGERQFDKAEAALKQFIDQLPDSDALRLALGDQYASTGRLPEAKVAYQALATRSPKSTDGVTGRIRIATIEVSQGNSAAAMKVVDGILVDVPEEPTALLLRAGYRFEKQKFDDAIADLRVVLRKQPANEAAMLLLAQTHVRKNEPLIAKDVYRRLLAADPGSDAGLTELVGLHISAMEFPEAEDLLRVRLQAAPDDLVASSGLVDVLLTQGKTAKAEEEARRMAALPNQAGYGDFSIGRVLAQKKDYNAAAVAYRKAVDVRAGDQQAMQGLVESLSAAGKTQEAIAALKGLETSGSADSQVFSGLLLADLYGQERDPVNAEKALETVIQRRPETLEAYLAMARLYDKDQAAQIRIYERGLVALPAQPQLSLLLGAALEASGQIDQAVAVLENAVRANPRFLAGINNLAALLLDHRTDKASIQRAVDLTKSLEGANNPALLDTVGWAQYRAGAYGAAVSVLERVVGKDDRPPVYRYHLGMAYLAAGNTVLARQELEKALVAGANYTGIEDARAAMAKLNKSG